MYLASLVRAVAGNLLCGVSSHGTGFECVSCACLGASPSGLPCCVVVLYNAPVVWSIVRGVFWAVSPQTGYGSWFVNVTNGSKLIAFVRHVSARSRARKRKHAFTSLVCTSRCSSTTLRIQILVCLMRSRATTMKRNSFGFVNVSQQRLIVRMVAHEVAN